MVRRINKAAVIGSGIKGCGNAAPSRCSAWICYQLDIVPST
jgi:hypothetical protein